MQLPNNLASFTYALAKLPQQQIAKTLSGVLLIYIAYLAAQATWMFVPSEQISSQGVKTSRNSQDKQKAAVSIGALEKLHLFGVYNAAPSAKPIEIQDAPETRLNLTLSAAVASNDINASAAIIENNGRQETYGIGELIKGTNATLEQVLTNRVLIKQSGRIETLMLDGINYEKLSIRAPKQVERQEQQQENPSTIIDMRQNEQLSQQTSTIKAEIFKDPGKITDYLRIVPKRNGDNILGYSLMPGKNPEFFNSSGLKLGDVAVQMNGFDLTVPSEAAQAMMALSQENQVSLLVKREDDMTEILFSIDN
jgi:general secretion pathway protein C